MKHGLLGAGAALCLLSAGAPAMAAPPDDLVAAAKKEGALTVIALPHDWCGYGALIDGFKAKYGIAVNELNPDGGSGDEVEAIKANKANKGPQAPDVIDVGLSFGPSAKAEGLLQPYKVSTWDTIPDAAKDADGYWTGDYYGVLSFAVNADIVKTPPADWSDLLKPEFKASVALAGDPRDLEPGDDGRLCRRPLGRRDGRGQGGRGRTQFLRRTQQEGQLRPRHRQGRVDRAGRDAGPRLLGLQCARRRATISRAIRKSTSSCRRPAWSQASTCRRSAPMRRIRTRRSSGSSISIRTKARSAGSRATATRSASTTWWRPRKAPADVLAALPPGGELRPCEVSDARRAEGRQGGHRQAMGRGRRRDGREVGRTLSPAPWPAERRAL